MYSSQLKHIISITHKAFYNLDLEEINSLGVKSPNSYNFRKSFSINVNKPKTELGCRTFSHRAAIAWNSLSDKIGSFSNPVAFKNWLKLSKLDIKNINISLRKEALQFTTKALIIIIIDIDYFIYIYIYIYIYLINRYLYYIK